MTYMFNDFKNIKTFPANTRVYVDSVFMPDLSNEDAGADLPLHIIHVGKITGEQKWFIDMNTAQDVFLTAKIETEGIANIRIEINSNLENLGFEGKLIIKNIGNMTLEITGNNNCAGTRIKCHTKLLAGAGSENNLSGLANVSADVRDAETDIGFAALSDPNIKSLLMSPVQRISSIPKSAEHSAAIYRPVLAQIRYLETAGLTTAESTELLNRVFLEEVI